MTLYDYAVFKKGDEVEIRIADTWHPTKIVQWASTETSAVVDNPLWKSGFGLSTIAVAKNIVRRIVTIDPHPYILSEETFGCSFVEGAIFIRTSTGKLFALDPVADNELPSHLRPGTWSEVVDKS